MTFLLKSKALLSKFGKTTEANLSIKKILETISIYAVALFLFIFLDYFINRISHSPFLTFTITILILLIFHQQLIALLHRFLLPKTHLLRTRAIRILEKLNNDLNRALEFNEVTELLFNAFDQLFPNIPFIFYILEDDKYYPAHSKNIFDEELLAFDLKAEYLKELPLTTLIDEKFKKAHFPQEFVQKALTNELSSILPFRGHNQIFAFLLIDYRKIPFYGGQNAWRLMEKIQKKAGLILENTALILDLQNRNYQMRKLMEVGQKILSSFDIKTILDFILKNLKKVTHYDAAVIFLLDKSGKRLLNTSFDGYDPNALKKMHLKVGQGSCGWVVQTGHIEVIDDVRSAEHYFSLRRETRSQVSIPLIFDKQVLGVICLESNRLSYFNRQMVDLLQLFAQMASIAIHNARQFKVMLAKNALEHELINASKVQKALLVQHVPKIEHLKITALNLPSKIVSGDLYDILRYDKYTVGLAIGDVSGKGAPAALMMVLVLAGLRSQKQFFMTACDIVYRLNNLLFESTSEGNYVTFFYAVVNSEKNKLIYTNAGHNAPILLRASGLAQRLNVGGIVIGFQADFEYQQEEVDFNPGDILLLYTDGITEAMNAQGEEFGEERLLNILKKNRQKNVLEIREAIIKSVQKFSSRKMQEDDMTLLICKYEKQGAQEM